MNEVKPTVQGCDCSGGLDMHATECAIWRLDPDERMANIEAARQTPAEREPVPPAEVQRLMAEADARNAKDREQAKVIGSLLVGGTHLFGKRVELAWPDGLPNGLTEEQLKDVGQNMLDRP